MADWKIQIEDEQGTVALGTALSAHLPNGSAVALIGTLGAGKTRLVQAFCAAEGLDPRDIVSPTFVLLHEYRGRRPVYHFDAYRLKDDDEFLALGPEEYFESDGITFVEWADRVDRCLPREYLSIQIQVLGPTQRQITISAHGSRFAAVIEQIRATLQKS